MAQPPLQRPARPRFGAQVLLAVACMGISFLPMPAHAESELQTVAKSLLEFEANVKWEVVDKSWKAKRPAWGKGVLSAGSPAELGGRIIELESHMGWESVQEAWKEHRDGWVEDTSNCSQPAQAASSLLMLESATQWSAVSQAWQGKRDAWVARLKKVARVK